MSDLEQLQFLLVGEALDLGSFDVCFQAQLLLPQNGQSAIKCFLQVLDLLLQVLPLVLQLPTLQQHQKGAVTVVCCSWFYLSTAVSGRVHDRMTVLQLVFAAAVAACLYQQDGALTMMELSLLFAAAVLPIYSCVRKGA